LKNPIQDLKSETLKNIKSKYFSDNEKQFSLKKDEYLIRQNEVNNRLFIVLEGAVAGYLLSESGIQNEVFRSAKDMFVGVHSFFSDAHLVYANVVALEDCKIAYIEYADLQSVPDSSYRNDFLPLIVNELSVRQRFSKDIMIEKEEALKKLYHSEKLSTLGQMAAGLAHELNNAIGVLNGNSEWIAREVQKYLKITESNEVFIDFENGFNGGQTASSQSIREGKKNIEKKFKLSGSVAKRFSKLGYSDDKIKEFSKLSNLDEISVKKQQVWELGVGLHDMIIASTHAVHVLKSIKQLSASDQERYKLNINNTINEALTLLKNAIREVKVDVQLGELPEILANNGELIQIWVNIIKNGCESMLNSNTENPTLEVKTKSSAKRITIEISDNGPGISDELKMKIFQPNFTTKKGGLSFGLGLGLSIVQRLIDSYNGKIKVDSKKGNTKFTIQIPV
jgi:signal transduction histidine kinase